MLGEMFLGLLAGCGQLALLNSPPSVLITSPDQGALVSHTEPLTIVATVDDDYTPIDELVVLWTLADGTPIPGNLTRSAADKSITFTTTGELPKGEPTITLRVIDGLGESERDTLQLLVYDDGAPQITWITPVDGGSYPAGTPLSVRVGVLDPDPLEDTHLALVWSGSAIGGEASLPSSMPESGEVSFTLDSLAITAWTLGLSVVDPLGAAAMSTVRFSMVDADSDHDGSLVIGVEGGDDCDDTNPAVHPGADERCNTIDDDCDELVDEDALDAPPWYRDADGDGFGDPADAYAHCDAVVGRVADRTDCDDARSDVFPGADELCNGRDDDCDGSVDVGAEDAVVVYVDWDEDGFGAGEGYAVCTPAADEALVDGDCDDVHDAVNPGAAEVCDTANTDEDCDGFADDDDPSATGQSRVYVDADGDRRGAPGSDTLRCDAATGYAAADDDCDDTEPLAWTGHAETCEDGVDNDCAGGDGNCTLSGDVRLSSADAAFTGTTLTFSGASLAALGDVDGDGLGDFAVGAWAGEAVYVVPGASAVSGALSGFGSYTGANSGDYFGWALAGVGDVDGDGAADLLVGAVDAGGGDGAAYLFTAGTGGAAASAATWSTAGATGEARGAAVAGGGDVDGDGLPDVVVGASGAAYVLDGASGSLLSTWSGGGSGLGSAITMAPDVDGDGLDDVLLGAAAADTAWLVYAGLPGDLDVSLADVVLTGTSGERAGQSVAGLGDIDGDGHGDLVIGASDASLGGAASGAAYVVTWSASVGLPSAALSASYATFTGDDASDRAGYTVAGPGDVDGDGLADLLVGAYYDEASGAGAGTASLVYGASILGGSAAIGTADARFLGEAAGDGASEGLAGLGDVDGDGYSDLGIGAPGTGAAAGTAYLVLGGGL